MSKQNFTSVAAEHVNAGDYVHARGELNRVREAGPAMHPKHGRIVRLVLESGAVLHFAPYASVSVMKREEKQ